MLRYETLMLSNPEISVEDISNLEILLKEIIENAKGKLISFDVWGKTRLSYPVKKNNYGMYTLIRFEFPKGEDLLNDIDQFFKIKINDVVYRYVCHRLSMDASLEYKKPEVPQKTFGSKGDYSSRPDHRQDKRRPYYNKPRHDDNGEQPVKTEPVRTEPVETEPVKTEPVKTEAVKTEPDKSEGE